MPSISSKVAAFAASLALIALVPLRAAAQNTQLAKFAVAKLPAASSLPTYVVEVIDGTTSTDCTVGGATGSAAYNVLCASHNGAWVAAGNPGTMAQQSASSVAVSGGTIDGTAIGATTPAPGTFTVLSSPALSGQSLAPTGTATKAWVASVDGFLTFGYSTNWVRVLQVTSPTAISFLQAATFNYAVTAPSYNITAANCAAQTTVTSPCSLYSGSAFGATSSGSSVSLASPSVNAIYMVCGWVYPHNTSGTAGNAQTVVSFTTPAGAAVSNTQISLPYSVTYNDAACKAVPVKASTTPTVQAISTVTGGTFSYDWMITVTRTQ